MSNINHHNPSNKEEWTQKVGAVAWAPHPNKNIDQGQPWPCLIYPSWSIAILRSGLFPTYHHRQHDARKKNRGGNGGDDDTDSHSSISRGSIGVEKTLAILSCKKRVKLSDLASNRVPLRVALNPGKNDGDATSRTNLIPNDNSSRSSSSSSRKPREMQRRSKVVVHFLGVNEWCVASIGDLTQYNAETALTFLRRSRNNRQSSDFDGGKFSSVRVDHTNGRVNNITCTEKKNKKRKNDDMNDWLFAMKEASIACEREDLLDPSFLLFQCEDSDGTTNNASKPSCCEDNAATISSTTHKMTIASNNKITGKPKLQMVEPRAPIPILRNFNEEITQVECAVKSCEGTDAITSSSLHESTNTSNNKIMAKPKLQMGEQHEPIKIPVNLAKERKHVEDTAKTECTPECFDDWRMGGNTEKLSGTSQSQFVLVSQARTQ
mmetsp:Transcript_791/g.883  ORF Transcript_791/g.883 Transcript_791/m.883 type:complete len:435 (+) Transcript_791:27-1331(+)